MAHVPSMSNSNTNSMEYSRDSLIFPGDQPQLQRPVINGLELPLIDPGTPGPPRPNNYIPSFHRSDVTEIRILGNGTFGIVSLVNVHQLGKVALKQGLPQCFAICGREMSKGMRELVLNIMLNHHPNIVSFYGEVYDLDRNHPYGFLMEYLPGGSLAHYMNSHLSDPEAYPVFLQYQNNWVYQIALALSYMHGKNIMHRDLNPNNVLIGDPKYIAKITDFGLSKEVDDKMHSHTKMVGTTYYRAPEVLMDSHYSFSVDVYSFAMTTYFIFSKMHPFQDRKEFNNITSFTAVTLLLGADNPRPQLGFGTIDSLIEVCWRSEKSERPTMDDVVLELNQEYKDETSGEVRKKYPRIEIS